MAKRMKPRENPYAELGVPRDAGEKEIRQAYRRRAKETHPDAGGSVEEFKRSQIALNVLTDRRRRAEYDATGSYDEPGPDKAEAEALEIISAVILDIVAAEFNPFNMDLRAHMGRKINESLDGYANTLAATKRLRARAEKLIGRFIKKSPGSPLIDEMLRSYALRFGEKEPRQQEIVTAHLRALEILKDYDFKADPKAGPQPTMRNPLFNPNPIFGGSFSGGGSS